MGSIMINITSNPLARYIVVSSLSFVLLCLQQIEAKDLQWNDTSYTHYSDQEPLSSLLRAVAASQKTPIILSDKIDAVVSGYYKRQTPKSIFLDILKSNGLVWYYDGDTLFVEREEEMQTGSVSLTNVSATQFTHSLERLGILDHHYQWISSDIDKMVYFKGPEPFVTAVLEMSKVLDKNVSGKRVYKWVDDNGITNFGSDMPDKHRQITEIKITKSDEQEVVISKPRIK